MKKNFAFLQLICCSLLFTGCQTIQHIFLGTRNVVEKTERQLLRYEKRKGLQTDNNYSLKDSLTFYKYLQLLLNNKLQDMEVYDKKGRRLPPYDTTGCPGPFYLYISTICNRAQEVYPDSLLKDRMSDFIPFKANTTTPAATNPEYTFILYWARFQGTLNKSRARAFERLLSKQKDCKIRYIKVSLDPRDIWHMRK